MKHYLKNGSICLIVIVSTIPALTACKNASCKKLLHELITAESYTAESLVADEDGSTRSILKIAPNAIYMQYVPDYQDIYLGDPSEGYLIYEDSVAFSYTRLIGSTDWETSQMSEDEFELAYKTQKNGLSVFVDEELNFMDVLAQIDENFTTYMQQTENGYQLISPFLRPQLSAFELDTIGMHAENNILYLTWQNDYYACSVTITDINATTISVPNDARDSIS